MHKFGLYEYTYPLTTKKVNVEACIKCGTIKIYNASLERGVCSEKMHANCNVKAMNMILISPQKA